MKYHQEIITQDFSYRRCFEMPTHKTFQLKSVQELLSRHIDKGNLSRYYTDKNGNNGYFRPKDGLKVVDPTTGESYWSTWTNDLNLNINTNFHMEARRFLGLLLKKWGENCCDVALLDLPYSTRQIKECYDGIGIKVTQKDTQIGTLYKECIALMDKLLKQNGIAIRFGWNTMGFGKKLGYKMIEVLDVTHGGPHNSTLVTVEKKI